MRWIPASAVALLAATLAAPRAGLAQASFVRGDLNADGALDASDALGVLSYLFLGETELDCPAAGDKDANGVLEVTDAVGLLLFLFAAGEPPAAPYPECGVVDPAADGALQCAAHAPCAAPARDPEITEWPVPWPGSRPRDPFVDPGGRVWFVGQRAHYAAYLEPETGEFTRYELLAGAGPHNLIVDSRAVWYAGNGAAHIGRLDPEDGSILRIDMPDPRARDPHTLVFDSRGDIWFTVQNGNFVGRLMTASGEVTLREVPTPRARPYGIVIDAADTPWFVEFGSYKLARIDRETLEIEELPLPRTAARPRRIGLTSDGRVWYVDYNGGYLGRFSPADGAFREWPMPGGSSAFPYGMAIDDRDRIWFVETGRRPNRFVGFDPATEEFVSATDIASGGGAVRHMFFHAPSRTIWFGTDTNTIGRARLPD
jgi:virginiamycin B lyase